MHTYDKNILITYDCMNKTFCYPHNEAAFWNCDDSRPLWQIMTEEELTSESVAQQFHDKIDEIAGANTSQVYYADYYIRKKGHKGRWYRVGFICPVPGMAIHITFTDIDEEVAANCRLAQMTEYDSLTGLLNHNAFCKNVTFLLNSNKAGQAAGEYAFVYFDVLHFKAINDMFGISEGNRLLQYIAAAIQKSGPKEDIICRQGSDRFIDIIKLDMLFLSENSGNNNRGGTILSAVIRMAKWLGMPVIAEGVEDIRQADFLRSIGCEYIQGFLYSRPLPETEYEKLISASQIGSKIPQANLIETE